VASDSGPVLHLAEAHLLWLLEFTGRVCIPEAVEMELRRLLPEWNSVKPVWLAVVTLEPDREAEARAWRQSGLLHFGEAAALALARQLPAAWFLTDDAAARVFAEELGLEVHGSVGVVLRTARDGQLLKEEAFSALDRLSHTSLWISAPVLADARTALGAFYSS
jgi:predicted nucleic acid-binding protein